MKSMRILLCAVLVAAMTIGASFGFAQDEDMDLFQDMDEQVAPEQEGDLDLLDEIAADTTKQVSGPMKLLYQVKDNFSGSLRGRYIRYLRGAEDRENADLQDNHFDYILKFNTYTSGQNWRFEVDGWAEGGNQQHTYAGSSRWFQDSHRRIRRHVEVNELFMILNQEVFDIYLGKKIIKNNISTLYSPADRLRPQDVHDPFDPKDIALWQTRVDYYWDQITLTGTFLPAYMGEKNPHASSRWTGSRKGENRDFQFRDDSDVEEDYPNVEADMFGYFVRAKATYSGWDVFTSFYHGPNPFSVLMEKDRGGAPIKVKKIVKVGNYALGFSTTYKKWEFHGEALYNHSYDGKDDNYFSYVGGATYTIDDWAKKLFMEQIDITLEYAREDTVRHQYAGSFTESSKKNRIGRNDIFTRVNFKITEDLKFRYVGNFEYIDNGRYNHIESEYKIASGLVWMVALETFNGEDEGYYGRWWRNDRMMTSLEYKF